MTLAQLAASAAENLPLPDPLIRLGVSALCGRAATTLAKASPDAERDFAAAMAAQPVARATEAANAQHYEVPAAFFDIVLGHRRKYSCCLYLTGSESLDAAEDLALAETCTHADLRDGQRILELGCGWGSLSLWMARNYPAARIVSVSNSHSQRAFIMARAAEEGLDNLDVITADMNGFEADGRFDRVVSVEMFEHMSNWRALFGRVRGWLKPDGRFFMHVFTHRSTPYRFDESDPDDWIARYFFTGGVMPSHGLAGAFPDLFRIEADWRWSGTHYRRTAEDWLARFDRNRARVRAVLEPVYGRDVVVWMRRWRLFFLATSGLFGFDDGREWGVSHYLMAPVV
jgi:cyclopropane-fatty-acyl-phospholipid synthase